VTSGLDRIATYRLQLTPEFGFAAVTDLLDHFSELGVSHLYLSPIAEAVTGSTHGYDVVDHRRVRAEFGGMSGLVDLLDAAERHGLGVVIDHVPNHVSVERAELNPHWWEMLRDGPASPAARWFDVDWDAGDRRVIIPRLGDPLAEALAKEEIESGVGDRGPELRYGPLRFPLAAGTEDLDIREAVDRQHYRLQWWRDPARNVRRFFTIDDLVAVRVEHDDVAETVDTIPVQLSEHPAFAGVRIDHVDGLADPNGYLTRLRQELGDASWILVEKILADGEHLPSTWPVAGTTGYEHIRTTEHALLDPSAEALRLRWQAITADERSYDEYEDAARREVLATGLRPDLERVGRAVAAAASVSDDAAVLDAIVELTLGLHRYRTYLPDDPQSERVIDAAVDAAVRARPDLAEPVHVVADLVRTDAGVRDRWQQLTGPVMAKGAEDRAFYRFHPLAALCEVGGAPGRLSIGSEAFHAHQRAAQERSPNGLLAGTTHDTKRSEHVRARALALAERSAEWNGLVDRWFDRESLGERDLDARAVLLALETTVTATPLTAGRLGDYLVKATREAELHTSWADPDATYERALRALAADLVTDVTTDGSDLARFAESTERDGWRYACAERTIRLTAPGVPDLYQGSLAPLMSLVDPDNRRPPVWDEQRHRLALATSGDTAAWWERNRGIAVVSLTHGLLALRRRRSASFGSGAGYIPLTVDGPLADRVLAYARTVHGEPGVVVAVCPVDPADTVGETTMQLPEGEWRDVFGDNGAPSAGRVRLAQWLQRLPVLVLEPAATD
jgi:(1->4)-alpha-D-glucan 1-alpha-D-glucosylmutase